VLLVDYIDEVAHRDRRRTGVENFTDNLSPPFQAAFTPFLPALGEAVTEATRLGRQTRGSIAARASYQFSSNLKVDTTVVLKMRGRDNQDVRPEVIWDMTDNVQLGVGLDWFYGKTGTFFGNFDEDDRFFCLAKVSF
jgi:hypothetical protein